jgi:abortive infection bacteriophage resistance protein
MKYLKPVLAFEEQADQLLRRGMVGDRDLIIRRLRGVSYYRLSGYWYPFRELDPLTPGAVLDSFLPGTSFSEIWKRYAFDRQLRLLVMDAIERIEVFVRSQLAFHHASHHGPFAYALDRRVLNRLLDKDYKRFTDELGGQKQNKESFVVHFYTKYGTDHTHLPVWMACELLTFGSMFTFYRGSEDAIRRDVAASFGIHDSVLESWLQTLNVVRNICAHHNRLWNRVLGVKPKIPNKSPDWNRPVPISNDRVFCILTICRYCLSRIAPQSRWEDRIRALLKKYPSISVTAMGFPTNWEQCPIWSPDVAKLMR